MNNHFFYRISFSTVWNFTISSSVYFQCHSCQLQINLCGNIKVPVVLIHTIVEEMPRTVKSKYIKHSAHDHHVPKNSDVSSGRIPKVDRYGAITILDAFLRVNWVIHCTLYNICIQYRDIKEMGVVVKLCGLVFIKCPVWILAEHQQSWVRFIVAVITLTRQMPR